MLERILEHLETLVSCNTTNPPRRLTTESAIVDYVSNALTNVGCTVTIDDLGDGCINIFAVRGRPSSTLFNVHLDTVPEGTGWTSDPFAMVVSKDCAVGRGVCDIKGAAAALLTAIETTDDAPVAVLFSTDEEAGTSRCVRTFAESAGQAFKRVVVAEPTEGKAVLSHRGIVAAEIAFKGIAGHAATQHHTNDSAIHQAIQWGQAALQFTGTDESGLRFNLGRIEGGVKANIVASSAQVVYGFRPLPTHDVDALLQNLLDAGGQFGSPTQRVRFRAPALDESKYAKEFTITCNLDVGDPVDFWTEAALFADAGIAAIVLGPGNIEQAHTADEWVSISQLESVAATYRHIIITDATK